MTFRIITIFALVNAAFAAQPMKVLIATGWGTEVGNGITDTEIIDLFDQANVCDTHAASSRSCGRFGRLHSNDLWWIVV